MTWDKFLFKKNGKKKFNVKVYNTFKMILKDKI